MPRKGRRTVSDLSLSSCARRCLRIRGWGWSFLNEKRDAWRKTFFDELKDIAADCKTKGEVAVKLNKAVYVVVEGKSVAARPRVSLKVLVRTLLDRGDPSYVFSACLVLSKNPEGNWILEQAHA